jgi:hypothetical protein
MVMITDGSDGKCDACGKPHTGQYFLNMESREKICCACRYAAEMTDAKLEAMAKEVDKTMAMCLSIAEAAGDVEAAAKIRESIAEIKRLRPVAPRC